jgi:hypothetical protein
MDAVSTERRVVQQRVETLANINRSQIEHRLNHDVLSEFDLLEIWHLPNAIDELHTIDFQARALAKLIRVGTTQALFEALRGPYTGCDRIVEHPDRDCMEEYLDDWTISEERCEEIKSGSDLRLVEHAILWEASVSAEFGGENPVWVWDVGCDDGEEEDEDWPTTEAGERWPARSECCPIRHACETQLSKVQRLIEILQTKNPILLALLADPECPHKALLAAPHCPRENLLGFVEANVELQTLVAAHPQLTVDLQIMLAKKGHYNVNLALLERKDINYEAVFQMWRSGDGQIQQVIAGQGWEPFFDGRAIQQPDRSKINQHLRKKKD